MFTLEHWPVQTRHFAGFLAAASIGGTILYTSDRWCQLDICTGPSPTIKVGPPQVYTRQRLINQTYTNENWLRSQLEKIESKDAVLIDGAKYSRSKKWLELIESKPTTETDRNTKADTQPPPQAHIQFYDEFGIKSDLRDSIQQRLLETHLDDGHDLHGNTLIALKFDIAALNPARAKSIVQVTVKPTDVGYANALSSSLSVLSFHVQKRIKEAAARIGQSWDKQSADFKKQLESLLPQATGTAETVIKAVNWEQIKQTANVDANFHRAMTALLAAEALGFTGATQETPRINISDGNAETSPDVVLWPFGKASPLRLQIFNSKELGDVRARVDIQPITVYGIKNCRAASDDALWLLSDAGSIKYYIEKTTREAFSIIYNNLPETQLKTLFDAKSFATLSDRDREYLNLIPNPKAPDTQGSSTCLFATTEKAIEPDKYWWSLAGRLSAYSVLPKQRVRAVLEDSQSLTQLAGRGKSGDLEAGAGIDEAVSASAIKTRPSITGFSEPSPDPNSIVVGWIIEPRRLSDGTFDNSTLHETVMAVISVPTWLQEVSVSISTGHINSRGNITKYEQVGTSNVESPGGISPPGAPRTVHDPLESHGSRCPAVAMA